MLLDKFHLGKRDRHINHSHPKDKRNRAGLAALAAAVFFTACSPSGNIPDTRPLGDIGQLDTDPTPVGSEFLRQPEIIGMTLALAGEQLSDFAQDIVYANGLRGKSIVSVGIEGKEQQGWWLMKGSFATHKGTYAILYNPGLHQWLKVAPNQGLIRRLQRGLEARKASMQLAGLPEQFISESRLVDSVAINGQTFTALESPHLGQTLAFQLRSGVLRDVVAKKYEMAFAHVVELARTTGWYQRDPNLGNVMELDGKIFLIDFENKVQTTSVNGNVVLDIWRNFSRTASKNNLSLVFPTPNELLGAYLVEKALAIPASSGLTTLSIEGAESRELLAIGNGKMYSAEQVAQSVGMSASNAVVDGEVVSVTTRNLTATERLGYWASSRGKEILKAGGRQILRTLLVIGGLELVHEVFDPRNIDSLRFEYQSDGRLFTTTNNLDSIWDAYMMVKTARINDLAMSAPSLYQAIHEEAAFLQEEYGIDYNRALPQLFSQVKNELMATSKFGGVRLDIAGPGAYTHETHIYLTPIGDNTQKGLMFWGVDNPADPQKIYVAGYYEKQQDGSWLYLNGDNPTFEIIPTIGDGQTRFPSCTFGPAVESIGLNIVCR